MRRRPSVFFLLSLMLILVSGGLSSVHDLLRKPGEGGCEYCHSLTSVPEWLPPVGLMLPSMLLDLAPQTLAPLLSPLLTPPALTPASQPLSATAAQTAQWRPAVASQSGV